VFMANRQRAGKDYLAGLAGVLFDGRAVEEGPVPADPEELKKMLVAVSMEGRRRLHFSNCRGHLASSHLEACRICATWFRRRPRYNDSTSLARFVA
jgi:hypothetical protein